jgi:nucleotidyltransferase substrate binding protein (TIGR01987 family)
MSEISVAQLGKAIGRLEESLAVYEDEPGNLMVRDSVIKRFEFTFEVAQSLLRKFVVGYSVNVKEREQLTFPTLIRTASQDGVPRGGFDVWSGFRDARSRTSHAYNEDQAVMVVGIVPGFLEEVRFLYRRLGEEMGDA